jgi:hypothetical protein
MKVEAKHLEVRKKIPRSKEKKGQQTKPKRMRILELSTNQPTKGQKFANWKTSA